MSAWEARTASRHCTISQTRMLHVSTPFPNLPSSGFKNASKSRIQSNVKTFQGRMYLRQTGPWSKYVSVSSAVRPPPKIPQKLKHDLTHTACLPTLRPVFNILVHGHHCSAREHGYCTHCSRKNSNPKPGPNTPNQANPHQPSNLNSTSQASWKAGPLGGDQTQVHAKSVGSRDGSLVEKDSDVEYLGEQVLERGV